MHVPGLSPTLIFIFITSCRPGQQTMDSPDGRRVQIIIVKREKRILSFINHKK